MHSFLRIVRKKHIVNFWLWKMLGRNWNFSHIITSSWKLLGGETTSHHSKDDEMTMKTRYNETHYNHWRAGSRITIVVLCKRARKMVGIMAKFQPWVEILKIIFRVFQFPSHGVQKTANGGSQHIPLHYFSFVYSFQPYNERNNNWWNTRESVTNRTIIVSW